MLAVDGTPSPGSRRSTRLKALGAGGVLLIAATALRLVSLIFQVKHSHDVTPREAGYTRLGTLQGTTFWIFPDKAGRRLDLRSTGGLGGGCAYHGPDLSSSAATRIFGPADYLQVCARGSLTNSFFAIVVPSSVTDVHVVLTSNDTASEIGTLAVGSNADSEKLFAFTGPAAAAVRTVTLTGP